MEDAEYIEKYRDDLEKAVLNCYLLFDPKKSRSRKEIFDWIDANPTDRMIIF